MEKATVEAIENTDVRGKKLYYLRVQQGKDEYYINVGEKTYTNVQKLNNRGTQSEVKDEKTMEAVKKNAVK